MVVRQQSFFFRNGDGVKEGLHRRLAETPAAAPRARHQNSAIAPRKSRLGVAENPTLHNNNYMLDDVIAHPDSPAGLCSVWQGSGVLHPNSPDGRYFDWSSLGLPHPNSPAGRYFDWSSPGSPFVAARARRHPLGPLHGVHGQSQPDRQMRDGLKRHRDEAQGLSRSYIVYDKGTRLQIEDREGLVAQIFFATDQSDLDTSDRNALLQVYNYYSHLLVGPALRRERPRVHFKFVGYADYRGSEKHNLNLSGERAAAVAEYFSPLKSSPTFSQGLVAMGEAEHPQAVTPGGGSVSAQLNRYRRVDVIARPVLTKVPDPPPIVVPSATGSLYWAIRLIDSAGLSVLAGGYVARLEIVDMTNQMAMTFLFRSLDVAIGGTVGASSDLWPDAKSWQYITSREPLTFDDFVGSAAHFGRSAAFGYGYSADQFILLGPKGGSLGKGDPVNVKFRGWGGPSVSVGYSLGLYGSLSKDIGPRHIDPKYMAAPLAGTHIRSKIDQYIP